MTGEHELWRRGSLAGTVVLCGRGSVRLLLGVLGDGVAGAGGLGGPELDVGGGDDDQEAWVRAGSSRG